MEPEPIWLLKATVLDLHQEEIARHGGTEGIRDEGMLESALDRPGNLYHQGNPKPDITDLAAAYAYGIARNHPFLDGNKRAALVSCRAFLLRNGFDLMATPVEKYDKIMRLAEGMLSEEELADWVAERTVPVEEEGQTGRKLQEDATDMEADIRHPVLIFRINRLFRSGMNKEEIYDTTRGIWVIGEKRRQETQYAFGVFEGVVRGVFKIDNWHPAGSTEYKSGRKVEDWKGNRWEFTQDSPPPKNIVEMYLYKSVRRYFKKGMQSPVVFVDGKSR
ncbi:MAG: type II toxin-antitoxin system death-on-curing family toxin [Candidatus Dadabacteria bacterium]|nr:type II toxin-antitoxin system death-on-curing family toxin [Candidatus Dadabacteria bacterium]